METWRRWRQRRAGGEEQAAYYRVTPRARAAVAAVYVGLIVALAVGIDLSQVPRTLG
jgi:type II secretory pathway component PulM